MMARPEQLTAAGLQFLRDRHLATFTSMAPDGTPHVTPVGFTWDPERSLARVITSGTSRKARNAALGASVVLCQLDGRRWISLQGTSRVSAAPDAVADAVTRYAQRYRVPRENPARVAVEIDVTRLYGSAEFFTS
jgi:PPOX class probable F420-dependent enzyme